MAVQFLSPKELAHAIGVSESSLKRWVDSGRLEVQRTAGGHRRIPLDEAVRFVRAEGYPVLDPQCFGAACCHEVEQSEDLMWALTNGLQNSDAQQCQGLITTAYLSGMSIPALCDGPISKALKNVQHNKIGGDSGIAIERTAVSIIMQILEHLRQQLKPLPAHAPIAVGGGLCQSHCLLSTLMIGVTLQDSGIRPINLGPNLPDGPLLAAVATHKPALVWRSITNVEKPEATAHELGQLAEKLAPIPLVIGGYDVQRLRLIGEKRIQVASSFCEFGAFARAVSLTVAQTKTPE
jgi:MerR family transcriptional regulator, light-induced transcriptional regulator